MSKTLRRNPTQLFPERRVNHFSDVNPHEENIARLKRLIREGVLKVTLYRRRPIYE